MKQIIQRIFTCLILGVVFCTTAWAAEDKTFDASNLWSYDLTVGQTYDITYTNRTFKAGAIETLCLPFSITKSQLESVFGEGTIVWEYTGQEDKEATFSKVNIENGLTAATPYIIKTTKTVSELQFNNVEFALTEKSYNNNNTQTLRHFEGSNYYFYGCAYRHEWYQACLTMSGTNSYAINSSGKIVSDVSNAYSDHRTPALSANFIYTSSSGTPTIKLEGYDQNSGSESGETEPDNEEESDDPNLPAMGFTDLGKGGIFNHGENAYCFRGNSTNIVGGAIVTITSDGTNIVCYSSKSDYTGWSRAKQFTLTADQAANIASNNYIFYVGAWDGATVTDITVELPGEGGGGGNTGMTLAQKIAAKAQLTDVPTLYITVPDAIDKAINDVLDIKKEYHTATIQLVDDSGELTEFTDNVMIKVRGNSTAKEDKKPYRLKFAKEIKDANGTVIAKCSKHDMLGRGYEKRNWALLANFIDPAMVRNALTYHIGEAFDMPFKPGYKFADVVINDEYRGTYQITDHVEVGSDRIEVDEDTGWYLEASRGDMIEAPSYDIFSIKNPEPANEAEETALKAKIDMWFGLLKPMFGFNKGPFDLAKFSDPLTGWRKYFNEESLVDLYTAINLTGDYDGFMTVKMYRNTNERMKFGPLWDKDLAFGNWSNTDGKLVEDMQTGNYFNEYIFRITQDPVFIKKVHDRLHAILDAGYVANMQSKLSELKSLVQKTQELNHTKWSTSYQSWNLTFTSFDDAVSQLNTYVADRASWFANKIDDMYDKLGGVSIVDNTIGIDYNAETGPTLETEYTVPDMEFVNNQYKDYPIPASAFNNKATSALITVTGPSTIIFKKKTNQYGATATLKTVNSQNGETITATYLVEGDDLEYALSGYLLINCNGNASITVKVTNHGVPPITPTERAQLTNLPTIYLDAATVDDAWKGVALEVFDKDNVFGQGVTWTKTTADVSAQYQGSGDKNKDSYRLKFESKIKLMGANKYKQWVLLANDDDPSMINNALAKELGDAIGMPWTPGYQFVDLYVNDTYMGTYQVTDRVKAEDGRSLVSSGNNKTDWQVRFNDDAELAEDKTTDYITATNGVNVIYKNPDPKDYTSTPELVETFNGIKSNMKDYFDKVFTKTDGTYPNFAANVDKDQLINWYICQEILGVYKGFSSIEAYRSVTETAADNLLHFGPLWDSEKAFGNRGEAAAIDMSDKTTEDSYLGLMTNYAAYDEMKSLFNYLWTQPWFGSGVRDKWNALKTVGLLATLKDKADAISGTLSQSQPKNAEKWAGSLGGAVNYSATISNIKSYLDTRFDYLDTKFNARAAGLCDHTFTYVDNGNGTHKHYCTKCEYTDVESEAHTLTMVSGKAKCSVCEFDVTAEVTGNEGEKVYILNAGKAGAQYITKTSGFTPAANTLYPINEKPEEGTVFNNVYWTENGTNYADNIIVTDGKAWLGEVKVSAKNATYSRTMSASSVWGTVCLPFKTEKNDDVTLYQLSESTADNKGNGTMVFIEAESTGGLTPLVYKKNKASATNVSFKCSPQEDGNVTVKAAKKMSFDNTGKSTATNWQLIGNVKGTQTLTTSADATPALYYIASNKFWHATGTLDVTPFRAYFSYTPTDGSSLAKSFSIGISDETPNRIEDASNKPLAIFIDRGSISLAADKNTAVRIYTISGAIVTNTIVGAGECKTINLPPGLYIVNGTKVTVK